MADPTYRAAMKRLNHYRACLVLLASMGIGTGPLLHSANATQDEAQGRLAAVSSAEQPERQSAKQVNGARTSSAADNALEEGIGLIRQGNVEAAIEAFERAAALAPTSSAAHYNLGLALRQNNQLQPAATAFWRATQVDPTFALAYVNLGAALLEGDNVEQAESYLNRAIELAPDLGIARYNMGLLRRHKGEREAAFEAFNRAISLSPSAPEPHYHIGLIYQEQNH